MSGRGTSAGISFQAEVGSLVAGLMLAERPLSRIGIQSHDVPRKLYFETDSAVDDIQIEIDNGTIFIQAKRTLSLSTSDKELSSAVNQFVRQFRSGIKEFDKKRDLDSHRDKLILAVCDDNAKNLTRDLGQALDRVRTEAYTALPTKLSTALQKFKSIVNIEWSKETGVEITLEEERSFLCFCEILVIGANQTHLVEDFLRNVVTITGDEIALLELVSKWSQNCSDKGVGGDLNVIRGELRGKIRLAAPPSFKGDIQNLSNYTEKVLGRLKKFSELVTPEGIIKISRPLSNFALEVAKNNSLAIIGEPGAGKSGIIFDMSYELKKHGNVVTLIVEADITSLDQFRAEIGLEHPILEVLSHLPEYKPSYLLIDALDAARGGMAEATYKRLMQEVSSLPGWKIIASIRTFDLKLGLEFRRIFKGTPANLKYAHKDFSNVSHFLIGTLDHDELKEIASKSPILKEAIELGGAKITSLTSNFFNLELLAGLLKDGLDPKSLTQIATKSDLIELYWQERLGDLGTAGLLTLTRVVSLMISIKSLNVPLNKLLSENPIHLDDLQLRGILLTDQQMRIGFRHHIFFDYAISKLILLLDHNEVSKNFTKATGTGLLISPSLEFWLEKLKSNLLPDAFWHIIISIIADKNTDPIIKVVISRVVVEQIGKTESLRPMVGIINRSDFNKNQFLRHLIGTIYAKVESEDYVEIEPWAFLSSELLVTSDPGQLWTYQLLIGLLLKMKLSDGAVESVGIASRALFDRMNENERHIFWLSRLVIPYIIQTYETDPIASNIRLKGIFATEHFNTFGYLQLPVLSSHALTIAEYDPELLAKTVYFAFNKTNFSSDTATSLTGGWIFSLTSNPLQDFNMAKYYISENFSELIKINPVISIRALALILKAESEKESHLHNCNDIYNLTVKGKKRILQEKRNNITIWEFPNDPDGDYIRIYNQFKAWLVDSAADTIVAEIPDLFFRETSSSLAWKALFDLSLLHPSILGDILWPAACEVIFLNIASVVDIAMRNITAIYHSRPESVRRHIELLWLEETNSVRRKDIAMYIQNLRFLFEDIKEENLVTAEAKLFLRDAKDLKLSAKRNISNELLREFDEDSHWLLRQGVDLESKELKSILGRGDELKANIDLLKNVNYLYTDLILLRSALELDSLIADSTDIDKWVEIDLSTKLAEVFGLLLKRNRLEDNYRKITLTKLLKITCHTDPETRPDTERNFTNLPMFPSPSPRIQAAKEIADLNSMIMEPEIFECFKNLLLNDSHPAVRFHLANNLIRMADFQQEKMWELVEMFASTETNSSVVDYALMPLNRLGVVDMKRFEEIVLQLARRFPGNSRHKEIIGNVVYFGVFNNQTNSLLMIESWIANFSSEVDRLHIVLFKIRNYLLQGIDKADVFSADVRKRSTQLINQILLTVESSAKSSHSNQIPQHAEITALKILDDIIDQINFAVGHETLNKSLNSNHAKLRFLQEFAPIISKLNALGTPKTTHRALNILKKLIVAAPESCFDLIAEALLRSDGVSKYEYESLGAHSFVELVGVYLADYRYTFMDADRRTKLIDSLALFVEAGWPEARRLFHNLPELLL